MLLSLAIAAFALYKTAEGLAPGTLATYQWALALLLEALGDVPFASLTKTDALTFMAAVRQKKTKRGPYANKTIENIWVALKSFDAWRVKECALPAWYLIERPDTSYDQPQPFTPDEVKRILHAAQYTRSAETVTRKQFSMHRPTAKRDVALIMLLLDTGLRAGEVGRLDIEDLDVSTGALTVDRWGSGKKTRGRVVYLGVTARKALLKLTLGRQPDDPLFVTASGRRLNASAILHLVHAMGVRAKVAKCHPHRFRHTAAIQFLRNGGDVFSLQRMLGHSSMEMSRKYVALANVDLQSAIYKASPVDNWRL